MLIKSTNVNNARLMDFYQVMNLTAGYLSKENIAAMQITTVANEFNAALSSLDKALKQAQKTGYTESIIAADEARDNIYTGFTSSLRGMTRFPDAEIAQSAQKLMVVTDKYGQGITRLPQREESAALTNMVSELQNAENTPLLQQTGLALWVQKLADANRAFDELYANRTEKEAEFIVHLTRTERANMQAAFEKLVRAIEAYAFINGEAAYKPLADKINTEIGNVKQATKARATLNQNKTKVAETKS